MVGVAQILVDNQVSQDETLRLKWTEAKFWAIYTFMDRGLLSLVHINGNCLYFISERMKFFFLLSSFAFW